MRTKRKFRGGGRWELQDLGDRNIYNFIVKIWRIQLLAFQNTANPVLVKYVRINDSIYGERESRESWVRGCCEVAVPSDMPTLPTSSHTRISNDQEGVSVMVDLGKMR